MTAVRLSNVRSSAGGGPKPDAADDPKPNANSGKNDKPNGNKGRGNGGDNSGKDDG
jgi:hypothetical protein